jgi:glutaredoxin 2
VITAGTYHNRGRHYFYDVCNFSRAIVIELRSQWYTRVVVEVEDSEATLRLIGSSLVPELAGTA